MSHEIIEKIKESEDTIIKLNHEMEKKKEQFQLKQSDSLREYQEELQQSFDQFVQETQQGHQDALDELDDQVQEQFERTKEESELAYQAHKATLIQSGMKEVLKDYGDFSNETRPHRR